MTVRTTQELEQLLASSGFGPVEAVELPILDTGEVAFAVEIPVEEIESKWDAARSLLAETGRWPLVSTLFMAQGNTFAERVRNYDLFSRFEYEMAPNADDISPGGLIARSNAADIERFLSKLQARSAEYFDLEESFEEEIGFTNDACGEVPSLSDFASELLTSNIDLDRGLMIWEQARACMIDPSQYLHPSYDRDNAMILFLPTSCSWDSLAYIHWFGTSDQGVENYIALGKSWQKRFGAELRAHYGTELQCSVSAPPQDIETAWTVAREHELAAPCTLAPLGIPLRRYAQALIGNERWLLVDRP